jgi:hypothetical protein
VKRCDSTFLSLLCEAKMIGLTRFPNSQLGRMAVAGTAAGVGAWTAVKLAKAVNPAVRLPDPEFAGAVAIAAGLLPGLLAKNPIQQELIEATLTVALGTGGFAVVYAWEPKTPLQALVRDVLLSVGIGYAARLSLGQGRLPQVAAVALGPA